VQLAGGVTAVQLNPIALVEDAVAVNPPGVEGAVVQAGLLLSTASIPLMNG
jgi:hypothetical protein